MYITYYMYNLHVVTKINGSYFLFLLFSCGMNVRVLLRHEK